MFLLAVLSLVPALVGNASPGTDGFADARRHMVEVDIAGRGIKDARVLDAMGKVERHLFVDEGQRGVAYADLILPIGEGQTISQPYAVAFMTQALALKGNERVLEVGTGSGYQAAVLSKLAMDVYTIEIRKGLYDKAVERLHRLGYANVHVRHGDGYLGWEEQGPFDAIMVTASADHIPPPLLSQLKEGGVLVMPLASTTFYQNLVLVKKEKGKHTITQLRSVTFVPMAGHAEKR